MYYAAYHPYGMGAANINGNVPDVLHLFATRGERDAWVADGPYYGHTAQRREAMTRRQAECAWRTLMMICFDHDNSRDQSYHRPPWALIGRLYT